MNRIRNYGEGEIRIGTTIYLHDDIYSIGFICQLNDSIMKQYLNISTGKLVSEEEADDDDAQEETTGGSDEDPAAD